MKVYFCPGGSNIGYESRFSDMAFLPVKSASNYHKRISSTFSIKVDSIELNLLPVAFI